MGLLISLRCSVIAKAAAVATSRPRRVTDVRTRCKARRFYGPLVNEVEETSGAFGHRARLLTHHHAHRVDRQDDEEEDQATSEDPVGLGHVQQLEPADDEDPAEAA